MRIPIHRLWFRPTLAFRSKDAPRGVHGECDKANRTIYLDPRSDQLLETYLHEILHLLHPKWTEERVTAEEERRWAKLSWKDKAALAIALGKGRVHD